MAPRATINADRIFNPSLAAPSDSIHFNPNTGLSHRIFPSKDIKSQPQIKKHTVIISIHGSCLRNGTPGTKASYSVVFGPSSKYNASGLLPQSVSHKSNNAQVFACQKAIETVEDAVLKDGRVHVQQLIIKTHSAYLVRCLTEYVGVWEENGWMNAKGTPVVNRVGLEKLQDLVREREREGCRVRFWLVSKEENREGVASAKQAFVKTPPKAEPIDQVVEQPWGSAMKYWMQSAHTDPAARTVCQRLGITIRKINPGSFTGFTAPLRRLIITGEDRAQNFERLFGPDWASAITGEWKSIRDDIVSPPSSHLHDVYTMLDVGAPFYRPRAATKEEMTRKGLRDGGARLDLEDYLKTLSISDSDGYVHIDI